MEERRDLGKDNIGSLLFSLAVPAIIGQIVTLLYNLVDRIFIGHIPEIGGDALTGVGVTAPLIIIISAFAVLIGMGGAPRAAIMMGRDDNEEAERILGNCFTMLIILSLLLTGFFLLFSEKLLMAFGASGTTLPYALEYMQIYTLGTIFVQLAIGLNPFISTQGFSKMSMIAVSIGAVINIVLDPIFIFVLGLGVKGAALATVISQAISGIWIISFLRGDKTNLKLKKMNMKLNKKVIIPVIGLGLSPFVMQITESLIFIAFNSNLQRYGGDVAVGAMTILSSAMQFTFLPLSGLTQGSQPIVSYNFGAGNIDRVKKTFKYLFISCVTYSSLFWLFSMLAPNIFASIFTNNPKIIEMATWAMRIYMGGTLFLGAQVACQQTFIALGNAKTSLFLALLRKVFLLVPFIYIFPRVFSDKVFGVFLAEPVADILAAIVTMIMFFTQIDSMLEEAPGSVSN